MSRQLLAMALAPLLGLFILGIGNGFLATLITVRLDAAGESATWAPYWAAISAISGRVS